MEPKFSDDFERREWYGRQGLKKLQELYPNTFRWELHFTSGQYDPYDAYFIIYDPITQQLKKRVWIEIKWRDKSFDQYILETKKLKQLIKLRGSLYLDSTDVQFLYLNFTPDGTYMWDVTNYSPDESESLVANKETSKSRQNKIKKDVIYLPEGKKFNYILNERDIQLDWIKNKIGDEVKKTIRRGLNDIFDGWS